MPKKLRINAIPQGEVKLNSTSEGLGAILHSTSAWAEGCSLLQTLATPRQGSLPCGQRLGVGRGWVICSIFSLKKAPTLPATPHPVLGHYSSSSHSPDAVGSDLHDAKEGRGPVPHSQAGGGWMSGSWGDIRSCACQELVLHPASGRCPFSSQRVWMRQEWLTVSGEGTWRGKAVPSQSCPFPKLPLHALSRRRSRATGCQCSLWERHASW